jgi:uncharacterized repeat protein (TIGR02543 family)
LTGVNFTATLTQVTLTYIPGTGGQITGDNPQTINCGSDGTAVTAVANSGYTFDKWSDGKTVNPRIDANVTSSLTVTAVFKQNSATALASSKNPSNVGEEVTFTATVTGGGVTPTGSVQFYDNGVAMGEPVTLSGGGVATYATSSLSGGVHNITAEYLGDGNYDPSTGTVTQTVNQAPPEAPVVTKQPSSQTKTYGDTATFTADASGTPEPTVQWQVSKDNGTTWTDITGATSKTLEIQPDVSMNGYQYRAVFTNDKGTATSNAATLTVNKAAAKVTLAADPSPACGNRLTVLTATVNSPGVITGDVAFYDNSVLIGTVTVMNGKAVFNAVTMAPGTHTLKAVYAGDANHLGATEDITLIVDLPPAITTQPQPVTIDEFNTATLKVTVSGTGTLSYQWYEGKSGVVSKPVGKDSPSFTTPALEETTLYWVQVSNHCGSANSDRAMVTVNSTRISGGVGFCSSAGVGEDGPDRSGAGAAAILMLFGALAFVSRRFSFRRIALIAAVALAAAAWQASDASAAQGSVRGGLDLQEFVPAVGGDWNYFSVDSGMTLKHLSPSAGIWFDFSGRLMKMTVDRSGAGKAYNIVQNDVEANVQAALGLGSFFQLGLNIPVTLYQQVGDGVKDVLPGFSLSPQVLGDISIIPKFKLYGKKKGFRIALLGILTVPTGNVKNLTGNGGVTFALKAAPEYVFNDRWRLALNAGYVFRSAENFYNVQVGNEVTFGLAGSCTALHKKQHILNVVLELLGRANGASNVDTSVNNTGAEVLAGLKYHNGYHMVAVGGGPGLVQGYGTPNYRVFASYVFTWEKPIPPPPTGSLAFAPADGGAVSTGAPGGAVAPAPGGASRVLLNVPQTISAVPDQDYKFKEWRSTGNATIADPSSPTTAVVLSGDSTVTPVFEKATGSLAFGSAEGGTTKPGEASKVLLNAPQTITAVPAPGYKFTGWTSTGNATIADPSAATTTAVLTGDSTVTPAFEKLPPSTGSLAFGSAEGGTMTPATGTASVVPFNVPQTITAVPADGYRFKGWTTTGNATIADPTAATTTVLLTGDSTVTPVFEKLPPVVVETRNVKVTEDKMEIKGTIFFDTGKSVIQKKSYPLLDEIATVLNDNPRIKLVSIEGHTDGQGNRKSNVTLSQNRAKAVMDYLIKKGKVDKSRLQFKGFGPDKPIADNKTKAGREKNRRVEFLILDFAK